MFELDEARLVAWGRTIGRVVAPPVVFALRGALGAGKSVLARAIARGAGITAAMPSPTFNLLFQYDTPYVTVNHIDLYRLDDESEVWELGWRELGADNQIVLIEWPERAESLLPAPRWDIFIAACETDPQARMISLVPVADPPALPLPGPRA